MFKMPDTDYVAPLVFKYSYKYDGNYSMN